MGVTIHYSGQLKSNNDFSEVISIAKDFAISNEMIYSIFEETDEVLLRVKDEKEIEYQGPTKGIRIQPSDNCEPLLFEFDSDNYMQDYCKTQFSGVEIHIKIIRLFQEIEVHFDKLIVDDEGEFWETNDVEILQEHIDNCFGQMENLKRENSKYSGPYREANGRIVDLMS